MARRFTSMVKSCEASETTQCPDSARASIEVRPFHDTDDFVADRMLGHARAERAHHPRHLLRHGPDIGQGFNTGLAHLKQLAERA